MSGFCQKFSTLAEEAFKNSLQTWMPFLSNFHSGKTTQERIIVERLLKNLKQQFTSHSVHGVLSFIHDVYSVICDYIRIKKAETDNTGI